MLNKRLIKVRFWILEVLLLLVFPVLLLLGTLSAVFKCVFKKQKSVTGDVALITGSANGLGKQIALRLAEKGCHIAVVDIDGEAAERTSKELVDTYNIKSKAFKVDITKYENVAKLAKDIEEQLGPVTILVNNAGILTFKNCVKPTPEEVHNMIDTNLTSHVYTIRVFLDKMRELGRGHIVAIASIAGVMPCHRQLEYTASKFGVRGLMLALQTELYALNAEFIDTTTVFPFFLNTNARVDELVQKVGINKLHPSITGEEASQAIIEGMLSRKTEVFIPWTTNLHYRLLGLLPTNWGLKILTSFTSREDLDKLNNS